MGAEFEKSTHEQYDTRFGYRLMEALRNYVQHRGSPLHAVSRKGGWVAPDHKKLRFSTRALMRVTDLAEDPKFKKSILDELKQLGKELDLQPFVREYIGGLSVVHQRLRDSLSSDLANWEKLIVGAMERFRQSFPERAATGGNIFAMSAEEEVWLSTDFVDARRKLAEKNLNLSNLPVRFVTNETDTK